MSRSAFCRKEGLGYKSFLAWIKRSPTVTRSNGAGSAFIEMRRPPSGIDQGGRLSEATIGLTCGLTLRVAPGTDADWIGRVVVAVRRC